MLAHACQPIGYHLSLNLLHSKQSLQVAKISSLAGLVHAIHITAEPAAVVEDKGLFCFSEEWQIEHKAYDSSARPSLPVVAVHSHNSLFIV